MRRRLLTGTLALVLATLIAFALPLAIAVRGVLTDRAVGSLQASVEQIGLLLDGGARTCDELAVSVARLRQGPTAVTAVTDGTVLATSAVSPPEFGPELEVAGAGQVGQRVGEQRIAVAAPLSTPVCGTPTVLHATEPVDVLQTQVRSAWAAIAVLAAVVAGGAVGAAWWFGRRLASPFEDLAGSARRLGEGDFSARAPRTGLPEADAIADALDGTAQRLGRAVERSTTFTADASHQLRTPLTALRLQLETLEASGAPPAVVAAALGEADRLEATIDDLVALTRLETPEDDVDLREPVERRPPAWRALAAERGREVTVELHPSPRVAVRPGAIAQALQVLLDNALEHGAGQVTVEVTPVGREESTGAVRVRVGDEGRADGEHDDRPGGRGLPLARALIAGEDGRLTVDAGPDRPTRVSLVVAGHEQAR